MLKDIGTKMLPLQIVERRKMGVPNPFLLLLAKGSRKPPQITRCGRNGT